MCLIFPTNLSETFFSSKNKRVRSDKKCILVYVILFLSDFLESFIFSTDFRKIFKYQTTKIRLLGDELFRADIRTGGQT